MTKSKYNNHFKFLIIILSLLLIVTAAYVYTVQKQQTYLKNMVTYHTKMIKSGSISSLVKLGKMYEKGEGVEKNLKKANELFKKAINFNQYLDEIIPNTTDNNVNDEDFDDINFSNKSITDSSNISKINNNFTTVESSFSNKQKTRKSNSIKTIDNYSKKPKYIPYIKKDNTKNKKSKSSRSKHTFNNVIVIDKKTRQFSNTKIKLKPAVQRNKKQITTSSTKIKRQARERTRKNKIAERKKRINTKKVADTKTRKKLKKQKQAKARTRAKRDAQAKARVRAKKLAEARAYAKISNYKKTLGLKNTQTKVLTKKPRLEAKRSPTLNEERPDVNLELGINEEEVQVDNDDDSIISVQQDNSQKIGKNFTSNPCDTASSKYIAKCRRLNNRK